MDEYPSSVAFRATRSVLTKPMAMIDRDTLRRADMHDSLPPPEGWESVQHPPSLFRRFEFPAYRDTRGFLDRLAGLSKETGLYPDLGFGPTHVNVTIYGADGNVPGNREVEFASRAAALAFPV
jgi:pterin-4a-carbinolamine dehydratase